MTMYDLPVLLRLWDRGELTAEQAVGQLMQHLSVLEQRLSEVEKAGSQRPRPPAPPAKSKA